MPLTRGPFPFHVTFSSTAAVVLEVIGIDVISPFPNRASPPVAAAIPGDTVINLSLEVRSANISES